MDDERFSIARGRLTRAAGYLAPLFYRLTPTPSREAVPPRTDGTRFVYDPEWLRADADEGGLMACAALAHATLHCLLGHPWHARDGKDADFAADMAVALLMDDCVRPYCPFRDDPLFVEARRRLNGVALAHIGEAMAADPFFEARKPALSRLIALDSHDLWGATPEGRTASGGWGDSAALLGAIRRGGHGGGIGREPGEQRFRFTPTPASGSAYGALLRRYAVLREEAREDPDSFEPGLYAHGLAMYGDMPLIEPSETRESRGLESLAVVIDTSGSCVRELTRRFLGETCALVSEDGLFFRRFNLWIIQCDAAVRRVDRVTCARDFERYIEDLEIIGGGGTDFTPAIRYIDRLVARDDCVRLPCAIIFTDGRGIFPSQPPAYDVVVACYRDHCDPIDVPAWARRLVL